jgi:hypothetical protein
MFRRRIIVDAPPPPVTIDPSQSLVAIPSVNVPPSAVDSRDESDDFDDVLPLPPPSFRRISGTVRRFNCVAATCSCVARPPFSASPIVDGARFTADIDESVMEQSHFRRGGGVAARDRKWAGGSDATVALRWRLSRDLGNGGDDDDLFLLLLLLLLLWRKECIIDGVDKADDGLVTDGVAVNEYDVLRCGSRMRCDFGPAGGSGGFCC